MKHYYLERLKRVQHLFLLAVITIIILLASNKDIFAASGFFDDLNFISSGDNPGWFMDTMKIREAHQYGQGEGISVALLDSGVDINHPSLINCIDTNLSWNVADNNNDLTDYLQHGTMMAGLICGSCDNNPQYCGVAPKVNLIVYKISSGSGFTFSSEDITSAIYRAADGPAAVINLSLVITETAEVRQAVNYALDRGKIVVAAAGNSGGVVDFPASIDGVVAVGGVKEDTTPLPDSGIGPYLVLSAPGYNIGTTLPNGNFGATTGTSGAAALVSGVMALIKEQNPQTSNGVIKAFAAQATMDVNWPGFDTESGFGIANALYSVEGRNSTMITNNNSLPPIYLVDNLLSYQKDEKVSLTLGLSGFGGKEADIWVQETDPRGVRFYFQYPGTTCELPYPYNSPISSPYTLPDYDLLEYSLFSQTKAPLLSDGTISADAPAGLYEMVAGIESSGNFSHARVIIWIE